MIKKWEHDRSTQGLYSRHTANFPGIKKFTVRLDLKKYNYVWNVRMYVFTLILHRSQLDETSTKSLQERLSLLLQEPNETLNGVIPSRMTMNEKKTLEETVRRVNSEKKEEEFTDRLWTLLIGKITSFCRVYVDRCILHVFYLCCLIQNVHHMKNYTPVLIRCFRQ